MSLILATGTNLGDKVSHLNEVKNLLSQKLELIAFSEIFESKAVDYLDQPNFFNQVLEFKIPNQNPSELMTCLLDIETSMGRVRDISKGPRTVDIDIIFWGREEFNNALVTIPHPRWAQRSFVVRPMQQLPFFQTIKKCFKIPTQFDVEAYPINKKA